MGIFYYIHSVALIEDLPLEHHYDNPKVFFAAADKAYSQVKIHLSIQTASYNINIDISNGPIN